jgi:hypothetical protein
MASHLTVSSFKAALGLAVAALSVASPANADGAVQSRILPWLDFPADTVALCNSGPVPGASNLDGCWSPPALESWVIRSPFAEAVTWLSAQVAEVGWPEQTTYMNNYPEPYWTQGVYTINVSTRDRYTSMVTVNSLGHN